MPCMRWNCIDSMFTAVCFIGTVIMVGYWIVRYHKNEDVSLVEYRSMGTMENPIQVEFSLCIQNPFLEDEFKKISSDLSSADYIKYLTGIIPGKQTYEKISYENVTINLSDHFENLIVVPSDNSKQTRVLLKNLLKLINSHPWAREDLSLKVNVGDQTIWKSTLEL